VYKLFLFTVILLSIQSLFAYESEEKLKVAVIGKVPKFITWENEEKEHFSITVLNNQFGNTLNEKYGGKKIKDRDIKIRYVDNIEEIEDTDILYIPSINSNKLSLIINKVANKNILTISDIRGFADKGGIIQINFVSQKLKLKINLDSANRENLEIRSALLRISDVVKR